MFFPERIKSIKKIDKVLDVGPGYSPFYRSDVLLEKVFDDEEIALRQTGASEKKDLKKEVVYFSDDTFPFENNEFDYVICSHVLEHIPKEEIPLFISELHRVASKGYIEVPLYTFELITALEYHLNLLYVDNNNTIHFLSKEDIDLKNYAYVKLRELFIKLKFNEKIIPLNLNVFGAGFEFNEKINYVIHDNAEAFFEIVEAETKRMDIYWYKSCSYYLQKVMLQFNQNIFKQRIYNKFGKSFK
jgi:hypothetical protein